MIRCSGWIHINITNHYLLLRKKTYHPLNMPVNITFTMPKVVNLARQLAHTTTELNEARARIIELESKLQEYKLLYELNHHIATKLVYGDSDGEDDE